MSFKTPAQTNHIVLTTNQVTSGSATIGALGVPTNYVAFIRGDFVMSGTINFAASTQSIAVQNSNGVLLVAAPTVMASFSSAGASTWTISYTTFGSTNVLCQGNGNAAETWNGQWQGDVQLVPLPSGSGSPPPPIISGIVASTPDPSDATITWVTDQAANSTAEYGITAAYGSIASAPGFVTSHRIGLSVLTPNTTYHYRVRSTNLDNQSTVSGDHVFVTPTTAPPGAVSRRIPIQIN